MTGIGNARRLSREPLGRLLLAECKMSERSHAEYGGEMRIVRAELNGTIEIGKRILGSAAHNECEAKGEVSLCEARVDPDGFLQVGDGLVVFLHEAEDTTDDAQVHAILTVECDRPAGVMERVFK